MNDPIEYLLAKLFSIPNMMPSDLRPVFIVLGVNAVLVFLCLFKKNLLNIEGRREEKKWSDICSTLMTRMFALMPTYKQTVSSYVDSIELNLLSKTHKMFEDIPPEIKQKAEWDYCMRDAGREDREALLQEQFKTLLAQSS